MPTLTELTSCGGMTGCGPGKFELRKVGRMNTLNKKSRVREQRAGGGNRCASKRKQSKWK